MCGSLRFMSFDQLVTLGVLVAVIAALILDRHRADVIALVGAAVLLITGAVRPVEVQGAFASPAILALASLFVIAYAMELSGLLDAAIRRVVGLCQRIGSVGLWLLIGLCGAASAFLNNTPIVVMGAPVVRDVALRLKRSPKRYLMPLSYVAVLGGCITLIGTSTNLLVNDMAAVAGQPRFGMFEIAPVGLSLALVGGIYLFMVSGRLVKASAGEAEGDADPAGFHSREADVHHAQLGSPGQFAEGHPLSLWKALTSIAVFVAVIVLATMGVAPIAATAFAGAVLLIVLRVISADQAYQGLRPEILMLIAGMVVLGIALEATGLASDATNALVGSLDRLQPLMALILLYGATLLLTELLSNATVAVLITPMAVALAEALAVSPRPFLVAVMMAGSAAFATPFGYQTNVLVYQMGGYSYGDFLRIGLPLNLITWAAAMMAIPYFFPF
jgi:di/tricarboxylate transporter